MVVACTASVCVWQAVRKARRYRNRQNVGTQARRQGKGREGKG